jgi:hypothetical protein
VLALAGLALGFNAGRISVDHLLSRRTHTKEAQPQSV